MKKKESQKYSSIQQIIREAEPAPFIPPGAQLTSEPLISEEDQLLIDKLYNSHEEIGRIPSNANEPWIQTYTGRRFNPLNPVIDSIVIEDIAHALSMICRFGGHVSRFYSVAQHCVGVSYLCNHEDSLYGLLHDASEAYLGDFSSPLKHSGKMDNYIEYENNLQKAICKKFSLSEEEPVSVKKADKVILYTESRDLMAPMHKDWINKEEPLPFKIVPLSQQDAKDLFMKRFYELSNLPDFHYQHYLLNNKKS